MKKNLTQSFIATLKPEKKPYHVYDEVCKGLSVYVGVSGKKTFYLKVLDKKSEKQIKITIGPADALTVAQAREIANEKKVALVHGESIKKEKPVKRVKLSELLDGYERNVASGQKSGAQTMYLIRSFARTLLDMSVRARLVCPWWAQKN